MMPSGLDALTAVLLIPAVAAALLALLPAYRLTAALNVLAALADASLRRCRCSSCARRSGAICWSTISTTSSSC